VKIDVFYERHHILPKSIGGGNEESNLVLLTPREHFICHLLLVEIYRNTEHCQKMHYAIWCMINGLTRQKRHKPSSRQYERLRNEVIEIIRQDYKKRGMPKYVLDAAHKANTGAKRTEESKEKMRQAKLGVKREDWVIEKLKESFKNRNYKDEIERNKKISESKKGKGISQETKDKISATLTGRPSGKKGTKLSAEHIEKLKEAKRSISEETRQKMSEARKGKEPWNKGKSNKQ
jgi:hypothetical protein